jgi:2-methylisocitrate lyase-like PEP mutase family enzyme
MEAAELTDHVERSGRFLALHHGERSLLLPNPWDQGSARLLARLGFQALATHRQRLRGHLGRPDGQVTRKEVIEHAAQMVQATDLVPEKAETP